jgi:hypothetical protein
MSLTEPLLQAGAPPPSCYTGLFTCKNLTLALLITALVVYGIIAMLHGSKVYNPENLGGPACAFATGGASLATASLILYLVYREKKVCDTSEVCDTAEACYTSDMFVLNRNDENAPYQHRYFLNANSTLPPNTTDLSQL